jgi:hypothetical protein
LFFIVIFLLSTIHSSSVSLNAGECRTTKIFPSPFSYASAVAFTSPNGSKFLGLHNVFKLMAWFSISRIQESKLDESLNSKRAYTHT